MQGKIKFYLPERGFGFVSGDTGTEYFFHVTKFLGDAGAIHTGLRVQFRNGQRRGEKKQFAFDVAPLETEQR